MILINGKEITEVIIHGRAVTEIYKGALLVWSALRGLFATRFWLNDKAWNNDDFWLEK